MSASPVRLRAENLSPDLLLAPSNLALQPLPLLRLQHRQPFLVKRTDLRGDLLLDDRNRIDDLGHDTIITPAPMRIGRSERGQSASPSVC